MDSSAVQVFLESQLRSLITKFDDDQLNSAISLAQMELGWSLPISDSDKERCYWFVQRCKRHLFESLRSESSFKFDYKSAKLSNRFDQLSRLVNELDAEFAKVLESEPALFSTFSPLAQFGTYLSSGFATNEIGEDITHSPENVVWFFGTGDPK